jgi:16S rRNA (adenine(1408)-N(1))-methyltransferase
MDAITGKQTRTIETATIAAWAASYQATHIDLGTGDGRFVQHLARACPERAVIGIDACRDNLRAASRTAPANALFVIADALALPAGLPAATHLTINFPWGSLLRGLVEPDGGLLAGLRRLGRAETSLQIRLNAAGLAEMGLSLEEGSERVSAVLRRAGVRVGSPRIMGPEHLRGCPTTWAKRLAFGRDPRAVELTAVLA